MAAADEEEEDDEAAGGAPAPAPAPRERPVLLGREITGRGISLFPRSSVPSLSEIKRTHEVHPGIRTQTSGARKASNACSSSVGGISRSHDSEGRIDSLRVRNKVVDFIYHLDVLVAAFILQPKHDVLVVLCENIDSIGLVGRLDALKCGRVGKDEAILLDSPTRAVCPLEMQDAVAAAAHGNNPSARVRHNVEVAIRKRRVQAATGFKLHELLAIRTNSPRRTAAEGRKQTCCHASSCVGA